MIDVGVGHISQKIDVGTLILSTPHSGHERASVEHLEYQCQFWLDLDIWEKVVTGASMGVIAAPGHSPARSSSTR